MTLEFPDSKGIKVDDGAALEAVGYANARITFRCYEPNHYWGGILFYYAEPSVLRHCVLDKGGGSATTNHAEVKCFYCTPSISYCTFTNADENNDTKGLYGNHSSVSPWRCMFTNCGRGLDYLMLLDTAVFDHCGFEGNYDGILVDNGSHNIYATYCNFVGNQRSAVNNSDGPGTAYARHSFWNNTVPPYGPHPEDTLGLVNADSATGTLIEIMPPIDVSARRPIAPIDTLVSDTALTLSVYGSIKSYYDDSLYEVPVTMSIGSVYEETMLVTLCADESCQVSFPACHLNTGTHVVRMSVSCVGDSNYSNNTIYDTLVIRHRVDAAALQVVQPGGQIAIDDSIAPTALIANYSDSTRTVPVRFCMDSILRDSIGVNVGPHETAQAVYSRRTFPPGQHQVQYICCLPLDDDRTNDTVRANVFVKPGDYWVAQDSAPYAKARLCWDKGLYLYAAERNGSGVRRYNTFTDNWASVASPAVETIFGLSCLKGQVYALGKASGGTDEVRMQKSDTRTQNAPLTTEKPEGIGQESKGKTRIGGAFSNELGIYRYIASSDSWVLVSVCDTTLVPRNGSNLVADDAGSIYVIEGGSTRLLRYFVGQDSWVSVTAPGLIDRWGAAAWSRGRLYLLADKYKVLVQDAETGQWDTIVPADYDDEYGTALCADPTLDRLFAFAQPKMPPMCMRFKERRNQEFLPQWAIRYPAALDSAGAALCFGSTQAYFLDGRGGFWRYRPGPVDDVAAIAAVIPDTISLDSTFVPKGIVQNSWQDTLQFMVRLTIGTYDSSRTDTVPPQQWDTVGLAPTSFSPGTYPVKFFISRFGEVLHYNDTAYGSLFVRYRKDAQALAVLSPVGRIPYVNQIHPEGRVKNNSDETLSVWVRMTIGTGYADSNLVTLPPLAEDTVTFDTCHLRLGEYTPLLRVRCTGDEVPGNDSALASAQIVAGDYWKVLAQCPDNEVRLVGSPGSDIYSVQRSGTKFRFYDAAQDAWKDTAASMLSTNLSLCRFGSKIYDLGSFAFLDAGSSIGLGHDPTGDLGQNPAPGAWDTIRNVRRFGYVPRTAELGYVPRRGGGQTDGPSAITRYDVSTNTWSTVVSPLTFTVGPGSCLFATDDTTLFVLSLGGSSNLRRYNITRHTWAQKAPMPGSVSAWASGTYDNAGHFYVLTDGNGKLRKYNVASNTWDSLTPLNDSTPSGSALCFEPAQNVLYALWAESSPNAYRYDITGNTWTTVESFPTGLYHPALAQCADNPYGQNGTTFAKYVPELELDVAAMAILVPGDTERYDSAVVPTGVVHNLSEVPVWCQVTLTLGNLMRVVPSLYLEPDQTDTVAFDTTYLPAGRITATLHVMCTGDANPGNDTCFKQVQVEAPWEPRTPTMYTQGRLDADTGASVYLGARNSPAVEKYVVSGNNWNGIMSPPLSSGCIDLAYYNGALFALGLTGQDGETKGRRLGSDAGPNLTTHPAIYRYALGDTIWTLVADSLPGSTLGTCRWIVATGSGVYLEPGWGRAFFRHDSGQGWTSRDSVPIAVTSPVAMDWDRADAIFLLAAKSGTTSAFLRYSLSGDSWIELEPVPVQPQTGLSLATEPNGNLVLALLPADTGHALLYGYNRSQDTWTLQPSPTWSIQDGAAMTWAGAQAYALTGTLATQPSWFWCYDPGFAAYYGRGLEGVAGKALPLLRWQLTCAPNPLSARTAIRWQVPRLSDVSLRVYNTAGQMVSVLRQGRSKPGSYTTTWNGCDQKGHRLAAGVYVCTLDGPGTRITRKVVLTQ